MKKYKINLLKQKEIDFNKKFSYFLYSYLRYILVITSTIVIGVFFYRYIIDQRVIDLKMRVAEREDVIANTKQIVRKYEELGKKVVEVDSRLIEQDRFVRQINYALSVIPPKITLDEFRFENKRILLTGISNDYITVRILYERLKKDNKFKNVSIDKIVKANFGFEFSIQILI